MKIAIDKLNSQKLLSEIDTCVAEKIIGGASIKASVLASASDDGAEAEAGGRVFAFGSNPLGAFSVSVKVGGDEVFKFSSSKSSASITIG